MRGFLSILLVVSSLSLASTFAGMALFGMDSEAAMEHGSCTGSACHSMPENTSGMDCVDRCVSAIPVSEAAPVFFLGVFILALVVFFFHERLADIGGGARLIRRWHADIEKFILHQNLSTIVLRN